MRTIRSILLTAPALIAALLIAGAPLIQAIHLSECECGQGCRQYQRECDVSTTDGPVCCLSDCAAYGSCEDTDGHQRHHGDSSSGGHRHDPSTCPICQMYLTLVKGVALPASVVTAGAAEITQTESLPQETEPTFAHIFTASPRAPPCS